MLRYFECLVGTPKFFVSLETPRCVQLLPMAGTHLVSVASLFDTNPCTTQLDFSTLGNCKLGSAPASNDSIGYWMTGALEVAGGALIGFLCIRSCAALASSSVYSRWSHAVSPWLVITARQSTSHYGVDQQAEEDDGPWSAENLTWDPLNYAGRPDYAQASSEVVQPHGFVAQILDWTIPQTDARLTVVASAAPTNIAPLCPSVDPHASQSERSLQRLHRLGQQRVATDAGAHTADVASAALEEKTSSPLNDPRIDTREVGERLAKEVASTAIGSASGHMNSVGRSTRPKSKQRAAAAKVAESETSAPSQVPTMKAGGLNVDASAAKAPQEDSTERVEEERATEESDVSRPERNDEPGEITQEDGVVWEALHCLYMFFNDNGGALDGCDSSSAIAVDTLGTGGDTIPKSCMVSASRDPIAIAGDTLGIGGDTVLKSCMMSASSSENGDRKVSDTTVSSNSSVSSANAKQFSTSSKASPTAWESTSQLTPACFSNGDHFVQKVPRKGRRCKNVSERQPREGPVSAAICTQSGATVRCAAADSMAPTRTKNADGAGLTAWASDATTPSLRAGERVAFALAEDEAQGLTVAVSDLSASAMDGYGEMSVQALDRALPDETVVGDAASSALDEDDEAVAPGKLPDSAADAVCSEASTCDTRWNSLAADAPEFVPRASRADDVLHDALPVSTVLLSGCGTDAPTDVDALWAWLDELGLGGTYDFLFVPPTDSATSEITAVINFVDPLFVALCCRIMQEHAPGALVSPAPVQGLENNLAQSGRSAVASGNAKAAPLVLDSPVPCESAMRAVESMAQETQRVAFGCSVPKVSSTHDSRLQRQHHKTKLCKHHRKFMCGLGDACPFAHCKSELEPAPDLTNTKACQKYLRGRCLDKQCKYAHGKQELRATDPFYKTGLCRWWFAGKCNASSCRYAHGSNELRSANLPEGVEMTLYEDIAFDLPTEQARSVVWFGGSDLHLAPINELQAGNPPTTVKIAGACGEGAGNINGLYTLAEAVHNCSYAWQKKNCNDTWLVNIGGWWFVTSSAMKDADQAAGWMHSTGAGFLLPTDVPQWEVSMDGHGSVQTSVVVAEVKALPPLHEDSRARSPFERATSASAVFITASGDSSAGRKGESVFLRERSTFIELVSQGVEDEEEDLPLGPARSFSCGDIEALAWLLGDMEHAMDVEEEA